MSNSRSSRSTRNSQDAAFFATSATDSSSASAISSHPPVSSSQPVAGSTHNASTAVAGISAQPSPEFLAAVVQAVKASLAAEQASVSRPDPSGNSSVLDQATESSSSAMLGGVPGQDLSSQASALWTAGTGFSTHSSLAQVSSSQGRPALVVPSFVRTFAPPNPSLVSSCAITASPVASQAGLAINSVFPSVSAPILHQPFVVGPGFSPVPAKLVGQIVAGKFVELSDLLSSNIVLSEPEPQLLFDGHLVLTPTPKKAKRRIEDIATWMEAFSVYSLVLTSHFPHRWRDLSQYKLLILRTYQHFSNRVWLAYDRAFREHAAATNLTDWSNMNVQLFNFHAAGASTRGRGELANESAEPAGAPRSQIFCKSWNRGRCSAPYAQCRYSHRCSSCSGSHRASAYPGVASTTSKEIPNKRSPSPASPRGSSKSRRT